MVSVAKSDHTTIWHNEKSKGSDNSHSSAKQKKTVLVTNSSVA